MLEGLLTPAWIVTDLVFLLWTAFGELTPVAMSGISVRELCLLTKIIVEDRAVGSYKLRLFWRLASPLIFRLMIFYTCMLCLTKSESRGVTREQRSDLT